MLSPLLQLSKLPGDLKDCLAALRDRTCHIDEPVYHPRIPARHAVHAGFPKLLPYMNLGRIYAQKWMIRRAIQEFEAALKIHPGERTCLRALGQLKGSIN